MSCGKVRQVVFAQLVLILALNCALAQPIPASATASPSAAQPGGLVQGTPKARVDFRIHNGIITIPVRINGSRVLRLLLDTGMAAPVVVLFHRETAVEAGLKTAGKVQLGGAGSEAPMPALLANDATLDVSGLRLTGQNVVIMDEGREGSPWRVDGIVGKSLFDRYVAEIDFERSTVAFFDPAEGHVEEGAASFPIELGNGFPVFEAAVRIREDGEAVPLRLLLDIGHRNALSLNVDASSGILPPEHTIDTIAGRGVQGEIPAVLGWVHGLSLAGFPLTGLPAAFLGAGANPGVSQATAAGNVGSLIWSRFRMVIDYRGNKVYLAPNSRFGKPFPFNQAGLVLEQDREYAYFVRHIVSVSPAAEAGLREGDKILAVNGRDPASLPYWDVLDLFAGVSGTLTLTVDRGGSRMKKQVVLRRLL